MGISVESTKQPSIKEFKSPKAKIPLQIISGNKKGSFLTRESQTLEKLAEMTKGKANPKRAPLPRIPITLSLPLSLHPRRLLRIRTKRKRNPTNLTTKDQPKRSKSSTEH